MSASKQPILLVDDEPEILFSLRGLLRKEFELYTAESGAEALAILRQHPVHVIMTDQRMPQMTGVELLARVKAKYPQAVRMLFTGFADLESIIAAINQGHIFGFLKKPWQPEELEMAVRQAAAEYDRLTEAAREREELRAEVSGLLSRVAVLEDEVRKLGKLVPPTH
jgi:response regulator RpfG family c-di-GMP phosphodiesterase